MAVRRRANEIGVTAFAVVWLAGCTTVSINQEPETVTAPRYRYGVSWAPAERGGAVERGSGYVHVLHRGRGYVFRNTPDSVKVSASRPEPTSTATPDQHAGIAKLVENIVSAIEAGRRSDSPVVPTGNDKLRDAWERYCRGGEGLTEGDWEALNEAGAPENIPPDLAATCVPPK